MNTYTMAAVYVSNQLNVDNKSIEVQVNLRELIWSEFSW